MKSVFCTFLAALVVGGSLIGFIVPFASAQTSKTYGGTINLEVQPRLDGKVSFTNEIVHSSPSSIRLFIPKNATQGSYAMALYPINGTLSSLKSFSVMTSYAHALPRFMLCLQKGNHSWPDTFLLSDYQFSSNEEWKAITGGNRWGWTETNIDLTNYGLVWNPIDYWITKYGNLRVWYIGILLEYWAVDPDGLGEPLYADELTLNGVTFNIAPYAGLPSPAPNQSSYKISGYILDANYNGIGGANIIFNEPNTVPSVYSDSAGYYAIYAPAGTYHVNVWPPFDSNYIDYDERGFVVSSDMTKNITLNSGYKVSGYITSTFGTPVNNGIVSLNGYLSGWFSKDTGYYFLCVPAGTYKLTANPRSGYHHFSNYYESNFFVNSDIIKNITVVMTDNPTPSPNPNPVPTPEPLPDQGLISISVDATSPVVGSVINVRGRLTDYDGHSLAYQPVILSYADLDTVSWVWTRIGSANTTKIGEYDIQWIIAQSGSFILKVEWMTNDNNPRALNTTSISFLPFKDQNSLQFETNNIVSDPTTAQPGYPIWAATAAVIAVAVISFIAVKRMKHNLPKKPA